jgi:nucleolar protein 6
MALTKKDKDPTRAERKSIKRKLEEAIPDLPGDVHAGDSRDPSTPPKEGRGKSSKKRKLGESSTYDVKFQQDGEKELQQSKNKEKRKGKRAVKDSELHTDEMVKSNHKASDSDHIGESRSRKMVSINGTLDRKVEVSTHSAAPINEDPPAKKSKKERKAERKAAEAAASNNSAPPTIEGSSIANGEEAPSGKSKKNSRNRKKRNGGNGNDVSQKAEGKAPRFIIFIGKLDGHFACSYN